MLKPPVSPFEWKEYITERPQEGKKEEENGAYRRLVRGYSSDEVEDELVCDIPSSTYQF